MKLRIRGNSIRLRLTRSEVETFGAIGKVEESVDFGPKKSAFGYALETRDLPGVEASFSGNALRIYVPQGIAQEWVNSELVGIESAEGSGPRILVEKDFACMQERPGENDNDAYPNPAPANCKTA
jgi:hypothetical protein